MDRERKRTSDQKESGPIGYVQNAEQQNSNAIWKRLKKDVE